MRTVTLKEFVIEEFNRMLAEEGRDVRIVTERPRPKLATVVDLRLRGEQRDDNLSQGGET
jgi:hypothetical protein